MTKAELIKRMESLSDDDEVTFVILHETRQGDWVWKLLNPVIHRGSDPLDVMAFTDSPLNRDTLQEYSHK